MSKKLMGNILVMRKNGGFYNCFEEDAKIINYFFNYRIVNGRTGFPIGGINKIVNLLEDKKINYLLRNSDEEIIEKKFKKNTYLFYLDKANRKGSVEKRINYIIDKLSELNDKKLEVLIDVVEDFIDEWEIFNNKKHERIYYVIR